MYQVLFAEDELLVRLGLQNAIPWSRFEMELAAQAENGLIAYELYQKIKPDVVITDIRMEGMDGLELIKKIREEDQECAIIVISCLDDFETLRSMVSYNLTGYILKASMDMEEVFGVLEQAKEHLKRIGRTKNRISDESQSVEERFLRYLLGQDESLLLSADQRMKQMLLFFLDEESRGKINGLAVKFLHELVKKQIPEALLIETGNYEFCLMLQTEYEDLEERVKRMNHSVELFLGVQLQTISGIRSENETWRECYHALQRQTRELREEEKQCDVLIQKAIKHIREHHSENLSLTEIAGITGVTPSYFSHLFKKETGKNYIEFLNEIRLEKVLDDLRVSDYKIATIAEQHGFRNLEHFCRFFKKNVGISPAKWREQNK